MLVLLLGPSGVGKTTIANLLIEKFGWQPIISWITRAERNEDLYKVSVSEKSYQMLRSHGKLWSDAYQHGANYGLLRSEVTFAIDEPSKLYVLDFALSARAKHLANIKHLAVYVSAESDACLTSRVVNAGRRERLEAAIEARRELDIWYSEAADKEGVRRIVNAEGRVAEVAAEINEIARLWVHPGRENSSPDQT